MNRSLVLAAAGVVAVGALAACAGDSAPAADTTAAAPAAAAPATPAVYTINAKDFAFDAPDTISAGMVTLRLVNAGPELHHAQLVRIDSGHTYAELMEGLKSMKPGSPPPPWIRDVAGPNAPIPGGEHSIMLDLAPGNYALLCWIPSADHVPHVMKGMAKSLVVAPATGTPAPAPVADVNVRMTDYAWDIQPEISAGKHVLKLTNEAAQSHEMLLVQLEPGRTAQDVAKWVETMQGPPPGKPMGGISGMSKGDVVYVPVDLAPGEYALLCFLPDAKDGKMHVEHGMMRQITVK